MGNIRGFLEYERELPLKAPPEQRTRHFKEFKKDFDVSKSQEQASRCMDCGIPFCHSACPLGNIIPEFNEAVYRSEWKLAFEILSATNNFPEFTGRICPAPCEAACVLAINSDPVTIEHLEKVIIEKAFKNNWVKPEIPASRSAFTVGVVGSGPAGLAAAEQLNKLGHSVTVYERSDRIGGLLRYGIPDFKLEKHIVDRRIDLMEKSGINFVTNAYIGKDIAWNTLEQRHDAVLMCAGATKPRHLNIPGQHLDGVHFAMDFLEQSNRTVAGDGIAASKQLNATGKHVVVIGGGDTGADCVGVANRQGAASIVQIELLGKPPDTRDASTPWPLWPMQLRTSSSHEEGCDRQWAIATKAFIGDASGTVKALKIVDIKWAFDPIVKKSQLQEIPSTMRTIPCDLALIAIGFVHPEHDHLIAESGVSLDHRGNVFAENHQTSKAGIFCAGDMRTGQSLVVTAIAEGRKAAERIHNALVGEV